MTTDETLSDDLLFGAAAIAFYVYGRREFNFQRKVYYAAEKGKLPILKRGRDLIARKSELSRSLSALSAEQGRA